MSISNNNPITNNYVAFVVNLLEFAMDAGVAKVVAETFTALSKLFESQAKKLHDAATQAEQDAPRKKRKRKVKDPTAPKCVPQRRPTRAAAAPHDPTNAR